MLLMDVVLDQRGLDGAGDLLQRLGGLFEPPRVHLLWDHILDDTLTAERRLFQTGGGWAPDKPATVARKRRDKDPRVRANANKTNVGTGQLRDFMTTRGAGAQPLKMDADELRIGIPGGRSDVFYANTQSLRRRDPRVSKETVRRIVSRNIARHLNRL